MLESLKLSLLITSKHWAVYRKSFLSNILPIVTDPVFYLFSIGMGVGAYVTDLGGHQYVSYIAPGLIASAALWTSFFETSYNFYIRLSYDGSYKAMMTTPIGPREIIFGELLWVCFKGAGMCLGVCLVMFALLRQFDFVFLFSITLLGSLLGVACGALGLLATSFVKNINQFQTIYALLISPLFFFSGTFFPISDLPPTVQKIAFLNPLYYGIEIAQALYWKKDVADILRLFLPLLILSGLFLGFFAYRRIYRLLYK
ncbi:MAG: ABC transporter permease [Deltaproteobacteria bacterium CG11_big_fil_rev_8_21_14_0_20_45_16]|nr:MAG: ABC transporter permease [Deltaproteobacteria bacterium CG11_big_fil_rev_8_21_14_0_20_45_16]